MKPKLFVHIGHSKVASTSIQDFLSANIEALRASGYLVADLEFRFPQQGNIAANPVGALEDLHARGTEGAAEIDRRLRALHGELTGKGSRFDKAVISAENLCNPGFNEMFAPALGLFDVCVIYYIRRQDDWLVSAWKQWGVKAGQSLDEFCLEGTKTRYPAFTVCIHRWEPFAENVHVRPLHKAALHAGSITKDFAQAIGLVNEKLKHPGVSNASFDASVLDVLWKNPFLFQHRDDDRIFHFLEAFLSKEIEPLRYQLSPEAQRKLLDYFEEENLELHARYFPDVSYEAVFGNTKATASRMPGEQKLLVRFLGLQLRGIMGLQGRIEELERKLAMLTKSLTEQ